MRINTLIEQALLDAKLFDVDGTLLENQQVENYFENIKNYLLVHYTEGDRVGLYLTKSPLYFITMLACMKIGLTYIPLKSDWPAERIDQIQKISYCKLITDDLLQEIIGNSYQASINSFEISDAKTLYIMFTSGTTGAPKGVMIRRESYLNYILWMESFYQGITAEDRLLLTTDFTFDMSLADVGFFLIRHVSIYISDFSGNVFKLLSELEKYKITMHRTVPFTYTMLIGSGMLQQADLSSLKTIVFAGARFPYTLYKQFQEFFPMANIYNLYGPTEATIDVTGHKLYFNDTDVHDHNVSIGKEINNNEIKIINNELCIGGIQVMDGYLNDENRTREVMIEEEGRLYYKTGDLAFQDEQGRYYIVGRADDTVKVAGFRVNLLDIDAYIQSLECIKDSATVLMDDPRNDDSFLVTFLILNEVKSKQEIIEEMKTKLLAYQLAKKIIILETFPLNGNGKVDRKALKKSLEK